MEISQGGLTPELIGAFSGARDHLISPGFDIEFVGLAVQVYSPDRAEQYLCGEAFVALGAEGATACTRGPVSVPEPGSGVLLLAGLAGLGIVGGRRRMRDGTGASLP